jgi:hypothetical protein
MYYPATVSLHLVTAQGHGAWRTHNEIVPPQRERGGRVGRRGLHCICADGDACSPRSSLKRQGGQQTVCVSNPHHRSLRCDSTALDCTRNYNVPGGCDAFFPRPAVMAVVRGAPWPRAPPAQAAGPRPRLVASTALARSPFHVSEQEANGGTRILPLETFRRFRSGSIFLFMSQRWQRPLCDFMVQLDGPTGQSRLVEVRVLASTGPVLVVRGA